ncbi:hypothetical protein [Thiorhodococcus drewsii]|nr:hypothetical protein [Thiorhodococcus drewsii]
MRAYTSLLGHILGDNPEIEGYYEMHIGYFSWKSLIRQQLLYFKDHTPKSGARFIFDKILHNEHHVASNILERKECFNIFSMREPKETIKSIVAQFRRVRPGHSMCETQAVIDYYQSRLTNLSELSSQIQGKYLYMDAQALKQNPNATLASLTSYLELEYPLSPDYQLRPKTGKGDSGDHSPNLLTGKLMDYQTDYSEIKLPDDAIENLTNLYQKTRTQLVQNAKEPILVSS